MHVKQQVSVSKIRKDAEDSYRNGFFCCEAVMDAIPVVLRHAISVGLGLFIAMIGLCDAGIITAGAGTLVGLGDITSPTFIVGIISILVTVALACRNVPGSLLIGIIVAVIAGIPLGVTHAPEGLIAPLDFSPFGAPFASTADGNLAIVKVLTDPMLLVVAFSLLMSDFFDNIKVLPDLNANGKLTLGENTADHGGLNIAYQALQNAMQQPPLDTKDGFTPNQRFFLSYGLIWANNTREAMLRQLVKTDPHAPARWRVNGALPHIDAWYKAFNITSKDPLFISKKNRVDVW